MKINWFPGHMKKTYDELVKKLHQFDFVIQVLDARAINASSNYELLSLFENKLVINVVSKTDLSDVKSYDKNLICINKTQNVRDFFIKKLQQSFKKETSYYFPIRTGIVVGLPNIGKSTLINKLLNKKNLIVLDKPGTTKKITIQKINDQFYLYDSPGVMLKNIEETVNGYILCLIGCISSKVVNMYDLMDFAIKFLKKYYVKYYLKLTDNNELTYGELLIYLGKKWNYFETNKEVNLNLVLDKLYNLFKNGQIGLISYDNKDYTNLI